MNFALHTSTILYPAHHNLKVFTVLAIRLYLYIYIYLLWRHLGYMASWKRKEGIKMDLMETVG
jgi:hypothetical protein